MPIKSFRGHVNDLGSEKRAIDEAETIHTPKIRGTPEIYTCLHEWHASVEGANLSQLLRLITL